MSAITVDSPVPKHPWGLSWATLRLVAGLGRTGMRLKNGAAKIPPLPEGMRLDKITIPSRDKGRSIRVRIYTPKSPVKNAQGQTPVHVTFQ